jgi:peptidoglycan/xylan/chitin deacetylase (PgdA/CDA1 family)
MRATGSWALKRALYHSGLLALARLARQRVRGLVLRYHALTDGTAEVPYAAPEICLPVDVFRLQMAFVRRAYSVVPLDDLVRALASSRPLPPRAVAITFDDGYADNHRLGLPVLGRLGLSATVYLATGSLDGGPPLWTSAVRVLVMTARGDVLRVAGVAPIALGSAGARRDGVRALTRALVPLGASERRHRLAEAAEGAGVDVDGLLAGAMLGWAEVRDLAARGWTLGAHTVTHVNVALVPPAAAEAEIAGSRDAIAAVTGATVTHFAYPNTGGQHRYFDPDVARVLRRLGFRSGATSVCGGLRPGVDPFALPRLGVGPRLGPVVDLAAAIERQRLAA